MNGPVLAQAIDDFAKPWALGMDVVPDGPLNHRERKGLPGQDLFGQDSKSPSASPTAGQGNEGELVVGNVLVIRPDNAPSDPTGCEK
jgi:hypothetical protein